MASYAAIYHNQTAALADDGRVLAVVVTDGTKTRTFPADDELGLADIDWPTGQPSEVLRAGLANLYYFTVDGPHDFEGDTDESAEAIAASYGLLA